MTHAYTSEFYGDLLDLVKNNKDPRIGHIFNKLSKQCNIYITFIQNYPEALRTVDYCAKNNKKFADLVTEINLPNYLSVSLSELLYKPIIRSRIKFIQDSDNYSLIIRMQNIILNDVIKVIPSSHPDHSTLNESLRKQLFN